MKKIQRVVVLMMENQSFDRLLGFVPGIGQLTQNASSAHYQETKSGKILRPTNDGDAVVDHAWDPSVAFCSALYQIGAQTCTDPQLPSAHSC